ncbi:MAG: copper transporter [Firmicutes bacterium]|nr:copper transporter [Bacillota bacterium]
MIIDYKYHIASLVAVFLALGIGILIGSTMLGNDALIEYQKQVTDRLENQLQSLRETNDTIEAKASDLEIDTSRHQQFEKEVLPALVHARLADKKFALLELNGYGSPPEISGIINDAGGEVVSVTSINSIYDNPATITELATALGWQESDAEQNLRRMAVELSTGIVTAENVASMELLKEKDVIETSGAYGMPVDGLIIAGGGYGENKRNVQFDLHVIDYFEELNIPVLGVEETEANYSSIKDYQRKHISTVDNIDTASGQLAMVLALSGQPGNYGVKSTAQSLMPEIHMAGDQ